MTKRYKLKKDLPNIKAGTILEESLVGHYLLNDTWLSKDAVENNPDWFTEIKEEEPKEVLRLDKWNNKEKGYVRLLKPNDLPIEMSVETFLDDLQSANRFQIIDLWAISPSKNSWSDNDMIEFANNCYNEAMNTKAFAKNTAPYYFPSPTLYYEQLEKRKSCK